MTTYTKSFSSDFGSDFAQRDFHDEIENETGITPTLLRVDRNDDVIDIVFDGALSAGEQTVLDTLVSNHAGIVIPKTNFFKIYPENRKTKNNVYTTMGTFEYPGSNYSGTIDYIDIIAKKSSSPTSYCVRVVEHSNGTILAEKNGMTNTDYEKIDLGSISNIPLTSTLLDVDLKRNGGSKKEIYIQEIIVYYGN